MNLNVRLTTTRGTEVLLHPAPFQGFRLRDKGAIQEFGHAPMVQVQPALIDAATRLGGVPTATATLEQLTAAFGVFYCCCDGHLVALVCDLGEPEVRSWLQTGRESGHVPVILVSGERYKLVAVQFDDDLNRMVTTAAKAQRAHQEDLMGVMQAVLVQLEHGEMLAEMGVDVAALRHSTVSIVTPTSALAAESARTH